MTSGGGARPGPPVARPPGLWHNNPPQDQVPIIGVPARVPQHAIDSLARGGPVDWNAMSPAEAAATARVLRNAQEIRTTRFIIAQYNPAPASQPILTGPGFNLQGYYSAVLFNLRQGPTPPALGRYGDLTRAARGQGVEVHHLNQQAANGRTIPRREGLSIVLTRAEHQAYHRSMDAFWRPYQRGGALFGSRPTNMQYGQAQVSPLTSAGFGARQAYSIGYAAAAQREQYRIPHTGNVPSIPQRAGR